MGDNVENTSASFEIPITQAGFEKLIDGLTDGSFFMTNELRVYNFKPELTPLIAFAAALQNNPTLQTIGFARN
jgi:hypothetical protein